MPFWDITIPVHAAVPPWPGDIPFSRKPACSIENGDECNVSNLQFCSHFSTHLDVPFHFEQDGIKLDEVPIDVLIGPVLVHEVSSPDLITINDLPDNIQHFQRIIFKTNNSSLIADETFHEEFVSLSNEVAQVLVDHHYVLVGIDYFSIEPYHNSGHPVHHTLCKNNVIIVEGLDLRQIEPGEYELIVLPLKIKDGDGSPCRAILRSP